MIEIYNTSLILWIAIAFLTLLTLLKIPAPYGKFTNNRWGKLINARLGWFIMEIISPIGLLFFALNGPTNKSTVTWIFLALWTLHYLNRSIIYPLRQINPHPMPISIAIFAFIFNIFNGFFNGFYLGNIREYPSDYIFEPNFIFGSILFMIGAIINIKSDNILLRVRAEKNGYHIPHGFMYRYISFPNYFGEILEWIAFAIMTWSLAGLSFAIWTIANLGPRALKGHQWYHEKFKEEYPANRKAIIPKIL